MSQHNESANRDTRSNSMPVMLWLLMTFLSNEVRGCDSHLSFSRRVEVTWATGVIQSHKQLVQRCQDTTAQVFTRKGQCVLYALCRGSQSSIGSAKVTHSSHSPLPRLWQHSSSITFRMYKKSTQPKYSQRKNLVKGLYTSTVFRQPTEKGPK